MWLTSSMQTRRKIRSTFSIFCRPIASATTTLEPVSIYPLASCSPSACSCHSVDANHRSKAMSPRTCGKDKLL
jgi:hypothetical protein